MTPSATSPARDQPDGTVTDYAYDLVGNLTTVAQTATPVAGGSAATSPLADCTYGPNGELLTAACGDGTTSAHSYDLLGRLTSADPQTTPPSTDFIAWSYD